MGIHARLRVVIQVLFFSCGVAWLTVPSLHTQGLKTTFPLSAQRNSLRYGTNRQLCNLRMENKKSKALGPGLFDPMIPVGPEDEDMMKTEQGKPLLSMEQSAESFNMFDKDSDGMINKDELAQLFSSMGAKWSDARLRQVLWTIDTNKDGMVSFGELFAWYSQGNMEKIEQEPEPELAESPVTNMTKSAVQNAFQLFDADGNNELDGAEMRELLMSLGIEWDDEKISSVMSRLGSPKDGKLGFPEFYAWFSSGIDLVGEGSARNQTQVILEPSEVDQLRVFVRGFPWKARESTAKNYFQNRCGNVTEVKMINWSRDGTPSGRCVITFKEKESVEQAMFLHRSRMGKRWLEVYRVNEGDREEIHKVERSKHGALIGIKGQTVKEMQASSGARIFFEASPESVMIIKGRDRERAKAWSLAQAVMAQDAPAVHDVPSTFHGRLIGAKGKMKKLMEADSGAHIVYRQEPNPRCEIYGSKEAKERAWELIQAKLWDWRHTEETRFAMAKKFHGTLVGKGSVVIQALQEQSGARVRLTDDEVELDGKTVKGCMVCRGTDEQCQKALELAQIFINELPSVLAELREEDLGLGGLGALPMSPRQTWEAAVDEAMEKGGWVKVERQKEDQKERQEDAASEASILML